MNNLIKTALLTCSKQRGLMVMVFNATFNNISVIPWRSVLLMEETGGPRENHLPQVTQILSDNVVSSTPYTSHKRDSNSQR
jgi:hypothetical protein